MGALATPLPIKKWAVQDWNFDVELSKVLDDSFAMKHTSELWKPLTNINLQYLVSFLHLPMTGIFPIKKQPI